MSKIVKLIPNKDAIGVVVPENISLEGNILSLTLGCNQFEVGEFFDVIIEEGNRLKFLKASFKSQKDKNASFEVLSERDIIKREYERIAMVLDIKSDNFFGKTVNISAGGMQIQSENSLEENKVYELEIDYISKKISLEYDVLRVKKDKNRFLISGKFINLNKDNKAFIIQQNLKNKIFGLKYSPNWKKSGGDNV